MSDCVAGAKRANFADQAYRRLVITGAQVVVGRSCSMGGVPPAGWREFHTLVVDERVDLLWRLLEAPGREAQVYGAIGLREVGAVDRVQFHELIAQIRGPVDACSGCIFWSTTAEQAVVAHDEWSSA